MTPEIALLLFSVGAVAGAINAVAGGGTFLTFPALMLSGVSPIQANATSTVVVWPASLASSRAYRKDLTADPRMVASLAATSVAGGAAGSLVLLSTPEAVFKELVPYLMLGATLVFIYGRHVAAWLHVRIAEAGKEWRLGAGGRHALQFCIALYGGYFGAGMGILMLAMLELSGMRHIHEMNAMKTILGTGINAMAVVIFILAGAVAWPQGLVMMAGAVLGGYGGAWYARRLPPHLVRGAVIAVAVLMTAYFFGQ